MEFEPDNCSLRLWYKKNEINTVWGRRLKDSLTKLHINQQNRRAAKSLNTTSEETMVKNQGLCCPHAYSILSLAQTLCEDHQGQARGCQEKHYPGWWKICERGMRKNADTVTEKRAPESD